MSKAAPTTATMLARAVAIGAELQRIDQDPGLHRLSNTAWLAHARVLAGVDDLDGLRARIADRRHLLLTIDQTAAVWLRGSQDRPALAHVLDDPDREPGAFSERLAAGMTVAEASALAAARYAEMAPGERWGRLGDFAELEAMVAPLHRELAELDAAIGAELRVRDLAWRGSRAVVTAGDRTVTVSEETVAYLASRMAETAAERHALAA